MVFDRAVEDIYDAINNWASKGQFRHNGRDRSDRYHKASEVECGSGIRFYFTMRLVNDNKTKLEIKVSGYEGKDEFDFILRGLMESLEVLKTDQPGSKTSAGTKTKTLNHSIAAVNDTLMSWVKENSFSISRNVGGDAFYKYLYCSTAAGIDFKFQMYMTGINETKLDMTVSDQKDREEFPMILKSLEAALDGIGQAEPESASQETAKLEPATVPKKTCQGEQ
jgi:hypothetical protein